MSLHVLVAGGGIGGLALAQSLKKAGVSVAVYERDRSRSERLEGYRIHIAPFGCRALTECLPAEVYDLFVETSGEPNTALSFFDHHLEELLTLDGAEIGLDGSDPVASYKSVSRITFREVLLSGLEDVVHFGKTVSGYEQRDGAVELEFADGTSATGDVLVGADGVNSQVRARFLPAAGRLDTGAVAIAGKAPLTGETRALLPRQFFAGAGSILAPGGHSGFLAVHRFRRRPDGVASSLEAAGARPDTGLLWDNTSDYVMWNVLGRWDGFGGRERLQAMDEAELKTLVLGVIRDWHPNLHELVRATDPGTVALLPLKTSPRPERWQTGNVTLLGDAIHSMPPTAGAGGNTALLDAATLGRQLIAADRGEISLGDGMRAYEDEMLKYAFKYVAQAERNLKMAVSDSALSQWLFKAALRTIRRIGPVRRKMIAGMNS